MVEYFREIIQLTTEILLGDLGLGECDGIKLTFYRNNVQFFKASFNLLTQTNFVREYRFWLWFGSSMALGYSLTQLINVINKLTGTVTTS
jgi:hypothetical protein